MKSIIIGGGSIGIRHFNNLKKLNGLPLKKEGKKIKDKKAK